MDKLLLFFFNPGALKLKSGQQLIDSIWPLEIKIFLAMNVMKISKVPKKNHNTVGIRNRRGKKVCCKLKSRTSYEPQALPLSILQWRPTLSLYQVSCQIKTSTIQRPFFLYSVSIVIKALMWFCGCWVRKGKHNCEINLRGERETVLSVVKYQSRYNLFGINPQNVLRKKEKMFLIKAIISYPGGSRWIT